MCRWPWISSTTTSVQFPTRNTRLKLARYQRLQQQHWPPDDTSPLHPIEPWGKQFFVFNAWKVNLQRQWKMTGTSPQLPIKKDVKDQPIPSETVLCITLYNREPLMYLNRKDFEELVLHLKEIKSEFGRFRVQLEKEEKDQTHKLQEEILPKKRYTRQRQVTASKYKPPVTRGHRHEPRTQGKKQMNFQSNAISELLNNSSITQKQICRDQNESYEGSICLDPVGLTVSEVGNHQNSSCIVSALRFCRPLCPKSSQCVIEITTNRRTITAVQGARLTVSTIHRRTNSSDHSNQHSTGPTEQMKI